MEELEAQKNGESNDDESEEEVPAEASSSDEAERAETQAVEEEAPKAVS